MMSKQLKMHRSILKIPKKPLKLVKMMRLQDTKLLTSILFDDLKFIL